MLSDNALQSKVVQAESPWTENTIYEHTWFETELTVRASVTLSRCLFKFDTAVAILFLVTYMRSANERP